MNNKRVVVLGAGPGGYTAAFLAADRGMNVTLIDDNIKPGGVCLHKGCIPTKFLLNIAILLIFSFSSELVAFEGKTAKNFLNIYFCLHL